ncbi:MAG TPA: hypothetical protein VFW40_06570 [Capsulimonadaceae bacterium]|nr:hypothetical protein [Capsulimonadaceae bacterium]
MPSSKPPSLFWYVLGALPGIAIGILAARSGANQYIIAHPGEQYDQNLKAIIAYLIVPLSGIAGALIGVLVVGLMRAPRVAVGWALLFGGSAMVLAMLPIRTQHGWWLALGDLLAGVILIGIGLKVAK